MAPVLLRFSAADDGLELSDLLSGFVHDGSVGVVVVLMIPGIVVPQYVLSDPTADWDTWRDAFEVERDAHGVITRESLAKAEERADIANKQAKKLIRLLEELGHRPDPLRSNWSWGSSPDARRCLPRRKLRRGLPRSASVRRSPMPRRPRSGSGRACQVKARLQAHNNADCSDDFIISLVRQRGGAT
ncbi:hypothetical protein [Streptomyces sp. NBC_01497]|uniref:hypothetical protein n=1 Tax=Streptomyces sp. NBC_01497 TaxID=2903885 RepID=UPI002E3642F6|nr:hypothetical protein [Streptomyces sp. NBC_01497]